MVTATLVFLAAALVGRGGYVERDVTHRRARPNAGRPSGCAVQNVRHLEWFHDDVRIERVLFDGAVEPERGYLQPDLDRPGLGLELKRADAAHYLV